MNTHLVVLLSFLFIFGCLNLNPPDNLYDYKGVTVARDAIPEKCWNMEDCPIFSCMVVGCWCKEGPDSGVVYVSGIQVRGDEDVEIIVGNYLGKYSMAYDESSLHVVQLNGLFYNVFYTDGTGDEQVLTVSVDGTVMETLCGV